MKPRTYLIYLCTALCLSSLQAQAQSLKLEHGITIGIGAEILPFDELNSSSGYGIAGGYYLLAPLSDRLLISLGAKVAFRQAEREHTNTLPLSEIFLRNPVVPVRSGTVDHRNVLLAFPVKFRYQPIRKLPLWAMIGLSGQVSLSSSMDWAYDEFDYERSTNSYTLTSASQKSELRQEAFNASLIAGLSYRRARWMFDAGLSLQRIPVEDDNNFFRSLRAANLHLNAYYQLN